ncbi:MAG TPA: hypothetical protein VEC16_00285, partial [Alphaproteobacteria bacterium]|nr:hypothetical protein [Alphaproteobacteria bacterium]
KIRKKNSSIDTPIDASTNDFILITEAFYENYKKSNKAHWEFGKAYEEIKQKFKMPRNPDELFSLLKFMDYYVNEYNKKPYENKTTLKDMLCDYATIELFMRDLLIEGYTNFTLNVETTITSFLLNNRTNNGWVKLIGKDKMVTVDYKDVEFGKGSKIKHYVNATYHDKIEMHGHFLHSNVTFLDDCVGTIPCGRYTVFNIQKISDYSLETQLKLLTEKIAWKHGACISGASTYNVKDKDSFDIIKDFLLIQGMKGNKGLITEDDGRIITTGNTLNLIDESGNIIDTYYQASKWENSNGGYARRLG